MVAQPLPPFSDIPFVAFTGTAPVIKHHVLCDKRSQIVRYLSTIAYPSEAIGAGAGVDGCRVQQPVNAALPQLGGVPELPLRRAGADHQTRGEWRRGKALEARRKLGVFVLVRGLGVSNDVGCLKSLDISDWNDLKGREVGVTQGTTQDTMLNEKKDKNFTLARYKDDATTIMAAVSGQVDCIATSATIIAQIGKCSPSRPLEPKVNITNFDLAVGVKKGEPWLLKKINAWIDANIANGKLNTIYKKFHGHELPRDMRG